MQHIIGGPARHIVGITFASGSLLRSYTTNNYIKLGFTFQAENLHLRVIWQFLFSRLECKNCTFPDMHRHFNLQLPCKTNGTPVDSSLDILISVKVPWSTRSEDSYFFPVLFSLLYVYKMFERPTLGPASPSKMYLSYMCLCS